MYPAISPIYVTNNTQSSRPRQIDPTAARSTVQPPRPGRHSSLPSGDLIRQQLAKRQEHLFAAEQAEARASLMTRASSPSPNPSPPSTAYIPPESEQGTPARPFDAGQRSVRASIAAAGVEIPPESDFIPHFHPNANQRRRDPLDALTRVDRGVRTKALTDIQEIMIDTTLNSKKSALALKRVRDQCRDVGVPFGDLLNKEIEPYGLTPLIIEILRCDFSAGPECLLFLLEHTRANDLQWQVRKGCMLKTEDVNLYESLRHLIPRSSGPWDPPHFEYEVSVKQGTSDFISARSSSPDEFQVLVSIPRFAEVLANAAQTLAARRSMPFDSLSESDLDTLLQAEPSLAMEWIACGRCWSLEIGANHLALSILDGEPASVDAQVTVVKEERPVLSRLSIAGIPGLNITSTRSAPHNTQSFPDPFHAEPDHDDFLHVQPPTPLDDRPPALRLSSSSFIPTGTRTLPPVPSLPSAPRNARGPQSFSLPRSALYPPTARGQHKVTLDPCFPSYAPVTSFVKSVLGSQELLFELAVRIDRADQGSVDIRRASVNGRLGDSYAKSPLDDPTEGIEYMDVEDVKEPGPSGSTLMVNSLGRKDSGRRSSFHM